MGQEWPAWDMLVLEGNGGGREPEQRYQWSLPYTGMASGGHLWLDEQETLDHRGHNGFRGARGTLEQVWPVGNTLG